MVFPLRHLLFTLLVVTLLSSAGASAAAPQPQVKGNQIVDSLTGRTFVPHGVNFPGFEYACQQGWGYGGPGTEPDEAGATVAAMAAWKINTVRLPLNQDCWLGEDGLPGGDLTMNGYRQAVDNFVSTLNSAGIVAIPVLHWSGPDGVPADGLRPMPDNRSPAFWSSVATRFKDDPSVIFDLFNEPHSRWNASGAKVFGLSWDCWAKGGCQVPAEPDTALVSGLEWFQSSGLRGLTTVVRSAGAKQPILLSGIDYANDLRGWKAHAPHDDQLIAGFHNYTKQRCRTVACWEEEIAPLAAQIPVLAAEFGQNDCGSPDHMRSFMKWADERAIGYLAWAWWVLPDLGCRNYALVSNLNGTPLPPAGTAVHSHLMSLPDQMPAPPARRFPSRLKIKWARATTRTLRARVTLSPYATAKVRVKVRLQRDPRSKVRPKARKRLIRRQLRIRSGVAELSAAIPSGLRPSKLAVTYPGDRLLKPRTVRKKPASVPLLTRKGRRG